MNRLSQIAGWLVKEPEPQILLICGGGFLAAYLCLWLPIADPEVRVRIAAFLLQAGGILNVAIDIRNTRMLFNRPGLVEQFRSWFARFPTAQPISGSGNLVAGAARMSGEAHVTFAGAGSVDASQRINVLEREVKRLDREIADTRNSLHQQEADQSRALQSEQREREAKDHEISALLEKSATGGLHLSLIGVVWLLVGVFLGSLPDVVVRSVVIH
jgi:hypothetical protein